MPRPAGKYREISIELIDEPLLPMRQSFGEPELAELMDSIRVVGVLEPILLAERGERYVIVAGHRRFVAAKGVGLASIPAVVRAAGGGSTTALTVHENVGREEVNPAEAAVYYRALLDSECEGDVDRLCALVRRRREYVEGRLLLLQGCPEVLAALKDKKISMAVANELNRIADVGYRRMYLDAASRNGASAAIVRNWRHDCERHLAQQDAAASSPVPPAPAPPAPPAPGLACCICSDGDRPYEMEAVYIHSGCRAAVLKPFLATYYAREE